MSTVDHAMLLAAARQGQALANERAEKSEALTDDLENQIAELQAGLDQAESDGRQGGLEAAGLYLENRAGNYWGLQAVYCPNEVRDKLEESAAAVRALKEPTP